MNGVIAMSGFFELIEKRESCRNFQSGRKIQQEELTKCLEAACIAPSACNSQPWSFIAVNSEALVPKIAECVQIEGRNGFTANASAFVVVCEETAMLFAKDGVVASQKFAWSDIGQAVAYFTLAAAELGLATCILGRMDDAKVKQVLNLPEEKVVRLVIAVGYSADEAPRKKTRKPLESKIQII